jgi:Uma2 family endonuclease
MRERDVERLLVRAAEARGGLAWKFVSPGHTGVPDRLVLLPVPETHRDIVARYVWFVEVKSPTGRLTELQRRTIEQLRGLGYRAEWVNGPLAVKGVLP